MIEDDHPQPAELSALLDGELPADRAERVAVHCLVCSDCAFELDAARHARRELRELPPVEPPVGFYESLFVTFGHEPACGSRHQRTAWWVGNAAAAVVLGLVLALSTSGQPALADATARVNQAVERHSATISAVSAGVDTSEDDPLDDDGAARPTQLGKPYVAPAELVGYRLVDVLTTGTGVQLLYEKGDDGLSVFESSGSVQRQQTVINGYLVDVVSHDDLMIAVVGTTADAVHAAAEALDGNPPLTSQLKRACGDLLAGLSPAG